MLWTLELLWGNLHQGIGSRQLIYRNEALLLWLKQCHRGWNIYLLIYLVSSCHRLVFYSSLRCCSFSAMLCACIDTRDKYEMDQRPPQTTAQLPTCCPSLSLVWRDRAEMQELGWGKSEGMALDIKFSLDVERNGLKHIHQMWDTPLRSTSRDWTFGEVQGTDRCSVSPEKAQPAMPRGWKLQLLAGSTRRSSFQHGPRASLSFQAK